MRDSGGHVISNLIKSASLGLWDILYNSTKCFSPFLRSDNCPYGYKKSVPKTAARREDRRVMKFETDACYRIFCHTLWHDKYIFSILYRYRVVNVSAEGGDQE